MQKVTIIMIALVLALVPGALLANDTLGGEPLTPAQTVEAAGPTFTAIGGTTVISEGISGFEYNIEISEQPDRCYVVTARLTDEILQAKRVVNGVETMQSVLNEDGTLLNMNQLASFGEVTFTPSDWSAKRVQVTGKWEDSKMIARFLELKVEHLMESRGWNDPLCDGAVIDELSVIPTGYDLFTVWDNDQPGIDVEKTDDAALTYRVKLTSQPLGQSVTVTPGMDTKDGFWGDPPAPLVFTQSNWDEYQTVTAPLHCGNGNATFSHAASGLGFDALKASRTPPARVSSYVPGLYIDNIEAVRDDNDTIRYSYDIQANHIPAEDITITTDIYIEVTYENDSGLDPEGPLHITKDLSSNFGERPPSRNILIYAPDFYELGTVRNVINFNGGSYCDFPDGGELPTFTFPPVE